ncbi:MAG: FkbM family methyltransferase [Bacteroidota bacterium]
MYLKGSQELLHSILWTKRHLFGQLKVAELNVLRQVLQPNDICLDIGAHGGAWAVPLSRLVPDGLVYAFEALPYYANVLDLTVKILGRKNVVVLNKAVVDKSRRVKIAYRDNQSRDLKGFTHIARLEDSTGAAVEVEGVILDSLLETTEDQRIRFVKMDIEGAEFLALQGASKLIQKWRPFFFIELWQKYCANYGYSISEVFQFFSEVGYESFTFSEGLRFVPKEAKDYSGKGDVLFVPQEDRELLRL